MLELDKVYAEVSQRSPNPSQRAGRQAQKTKQSSSARKKSVGQLDYLCGLPEAAAAGLNVVQVGGCGECKAS